MGGKRVLAGAIVAMFTLVATEGVFARVGGGGSSGSRGSRGMSTPTRPSSPSTPTAPSPSPGAPNSGAAPAPGPTPSQYPPPQGGGFLRGLAGGLAGGFLGSMLFGRTGYGADAGEGGGGIGFLEILLLGGAGYFAYRYFKRRREEQAYSPSSAQSPAPVPLAAATDLADTAAVDRKKGLEFIRRMDPSFDEKAFGEAASDIFFKLQGAWTRRNLAPAAGLLTDEMRGILQSDVEELKSKRQFNRLENISVRNVEIAEAWQESGQDYVTVLFQANLLDYTTDEAGKVLLGNDSVPVKFEEFWTFTRPVGPGAWRISAIQQTA